ncbi:sensor histidine kinase, partial [Salmonella enterica subsp. enterica]|nr:sensor histidine kinase [Salmonella enterica subsp. enterica serovar Cerro]
MRVRVPRGGAAVLGDAALTRQALINLTHNALRYTQHGGVLLAARRRRDDWLVEVWDTGMGIAPDEQESIFSPYYRSEHAWQIDDVGHGLGLAMVAQGARKLGVGYGMRSRLGRGSCFWVRLKAVDSQAPVVWQAHAAPEAAMHPLRGRCLVLDDDPQVIAAWMPLLGGWGVQARSAAT